MFSQANDIMDHGRLDQECFLQLYKANNILSENESKEKNISLYGLTFGVETDAEIENTCYLAIVGVSKTQPLNGTLLSSTAK